MPQIPYLFGDKEQIIQTETWYSYLSRDPQAYEKCVVKSLTHVKNLRSPLVHEYLQAIIEDTGTNTRTRIIAERQNTQDQVTVGHWDSKSLSLLGARSSGSSSFSSNSSSNSSGDGGILPLPLYSLKFNVNFKALELARILKNATVKGGKYSIWRRRHCYWFAYEVYDGICKKFACAEERWYFARWRGRLLVPVKSGKPKAEEFDEEIKNRMEYAPGGPADSWKWLEAVYKDSIHLVADNEKEAKDKIENDLSDLVLTDLSKDITLGTMKDAKEPDALYDDIEIDELYQNVMQDSEGAKYREVYEAFEKNSQVKKASAPDDDEKLTVPLPVPEGFQLLTPTKSQSEKMDLIHKTMVGAILAESKEEQSE
ncbi:hypothetical protein F4805DRAFT_68030 [Annulohypoxylon moriforme]|nr:hypothetical protein F4805DRAFT_68030 [Annulohypoxylon moriforme]